MTIDITSQQDFHQRSQPFILEYFCLLIPNLKLLHHVTIRLYSTYKVTKLPKSQNIFNEYECDHRQLP